MKKIINAFIIALSIVAAILTFYSNNDSAINIYKKYLTPNLSSAINKLFQNPNKYRDPKVKQRHVGRLNYFYLSKINDPEFETMKDFILDNFYTRDIGYEVEAIVQYQAVSLASDVRNINFIHRPVFFIKETAVNRNLDFTDSTCDEIMKDAVLITTEGKLTQNLDTFFTTEIRKIVLYILIIIAVLSSIEKFFLKEPIS